jgi:hypothetical protein
VLEFFVLGRMTSTDCCWSYGHVRYSGAGYCCNLGCLRPTAEAHATGTGRGTLWHRLSIACRLACDHCRTVDLRAINTSYIAL